MAQITVYVNYVIFFQDAADYNSALAIAGSPIIEICPADAAALFGIPYNPLPSGDMDQIPKGMYTVPPYASLEGPGDIIGFPSPSGIRMDPSIPSVLVPGQAGSPASIFPAGPDGLHVWSATIIRSQGAGSAANPPVNAISQRRWICGFEHASDLDGSSSNAVSDFSSDASRTIDGCGLKAGGPNNRFLTNTMSMLRAGLVPQTHWDRFYFRARTQPPTSASDIGFWRATCSLGASMGAQLIYQSTGGVKLFNIDNGSNYFDKGTVLTPTLNQWYRFDVFTRSGTFPATQGGVKVYINGVFALGFDDTTGQGIGNGGNLVSIIFGQQFTNTNLGIIDFDDWIGADLPANVNPITLNFNDANFPIDWLLGSHVRRHLAVSDTQVNWTPNSYGVLNADMNPYRNQVRLAASLQSSTALAQIQGLTDAPLQSEPDTMANVLGAASMVISMYARNNGSTDGQQGYRLAGGAVVQSTVNQINFDGNTFVGYLPSGMILPAEISPLSTVHTKSNDANQDNTSALVACVEYLGVWGPEDDPVVQLPLGRNNYHNRAYPNTQYGFFPSLPSEPVYGVGGTYVGNGTTQEIVLPGPAHFIFIRRTTGGAAEGCWWTAGSLGATVWNGEIFAFKVYFDLVTGQYKFQVSTNELVMNGNGFTYQYIAFCDPGMRYNCCGAICHAVGASTPQANALPQAGFLAEAGFIQGNHIQTGGAAAALSYYKGPGIGANTITRMDNGGNDANGMNFAAGLLNSFSSLHLMGNRNNIAYSLWRTADGGAGGCSNVMVQLGTYVGNGVSPRNISLAPLSGRMPLFVMVKTSGGDGRFKDPSHVGAASSLIQNFSVDATTGITAVAVDQITVQSAINNNGTTYSIFAICGAVGGMTNGEYYPTYCVPPGGIPPTPPQGDIIVVSEGGLILNGTTPLLMLQDVGGIYTLVPGKLNDTLQDTQTGQTSVDVPILPIAKTGYIGG